MQKKKLSARRELPVLLDAPLRYIVRFYVPMFITFLKEDEVTPWFYSSFINIKVKRKGLNSWMIYQNPNPFLKKRPHILLNNSQFIKSHKIISQITRLIDNESYLFINLDWYYVDGVYEYQKTHWTHSLVIYGYDLNKKAMYATSYINNGHIGKIIISFDNLILALKNAEFTRAWTYKRRENKKYDFNYRLFYYGMKGYINSKAPILYQLMTRSFVLPWNEYFGLDTHIVLCSGLRSEPNNMRVRIFLYYESKRNMLDRLKYIRDNGYISNIDDTIEKYQEVFNAYQILLNLYLKYRITDKEGLLERMISIVQQTEALERETLNIFLEKLKPAYKSHIRLSRKN